MSASQKVHRFLKDVENHKLIILRDDGVYRHIRLQEPGTSAMHFDLITWPGTLCYTGDMGTFVFSRLRDMFEFFRCRLDREDWWERIDRHYWAEKVESESRGGIKEFSEEKFARTIKEYLISWVKGNAYRTNREERRELWDAVMDEVIGAGGDSGGYRKQAAAHDFSHRVNNEIKFYFQDLWEYEFTAYTARFTWCCLAMAWGIAQYDIHKAAAVVCAEAKP